MANKNKAALALAKAAAKTPVVSVETGTTTEAQTSAVTGSEVAPKVAKAPKLTKTGLPALPKLKKARKPKAPKVCSCGCGQMTKGGRFVPGHDARLHGWALRVERKVVTIEDVAKSDGQGVADAVSAYLNVKQAKAV